MITFENGRFNKKINIEVENFIKNATIKNKRSLYFSGKILKSYASKDIIRKKTGNPYKYKNRTIRAGLEGEAWANRSGKARRGIRFNVASSNTLNFFNTVDYVKFLEDPNSLYRPAMLVSIKQNRDRIASIIESNFEKVLKGAGGVIK
jgi:hypothetical protein